MLFALPRNDVVVLKDREPADAATKARFLSQLPLEGSRRWGAIGHRWKTKNRRR